MSASQSEPIKPKVLWKDLGLLSYRDAFEVQESYHQKVAAADIPGIILALQHKPVLTLGKHADLSNILVSEDELAQRGVELLRSDRGGEVTAHMPGQLVIYPILPVVKLGLGARAYVNALMQGVIKTLATFGVKARCDAEFPGVWVADKKICAVGVRIKERVSLHGIALNVSNSLELYESIVPCGISHLGVTSLAQETVETPSIDRVQHELCQRLAETLCLEIQTIK